MVSVETQRLILRRWRPSDRLPFARLNADPLVMEFMPATLTREESDQLAGRIEAHFREHEFGLWAAELLAEHSLIGFIGLAVPGFQARFTPCVEIGLPVATRHLGPGLHTESAMENARC